MHRNGLLQKSSFSDAEVLASTSAEAAERKVAVARCTVNGRHLEPKARSQRRPGTSEDRLRRPQAVAGGRGRSRAVAGGRRVTLNADLSRFGVLDDSPFHDAPFFCLRRSWRFAVLSLSEVRQGQLKAPRSQGQ